MAINCKDLGKYNKIGIYFDNCSDICITTLEYDKYLSQYITSKGYLCERFRDDSGRLWVRHSKGNIIQWQDSFRKTTMSDSDYNKLEQVYRILKREDKLKRILNIE